MIKLFILTICALLTLFAPAFAAQLSSVSGGGQVDLFTLLENGGQSLAFLVAMYWLKDSHLRRVEESKEYATQIKDLKAAHKDEIERVYETHTKELLHCQEEVSKMTDKLWEWIKAHKDA